MKVRPTGVVRMGRFTCLITVATTTITDNNNNNIPKTSDVQILTRTTTTATAAAATTAAHRVTSMAVARRSMIDQTLGSGLGLQIDLAQLPGNEKIYF